MGRATLSGNQTLNQTLIPSASSSNYSNRHTPSSSISGRGTGVAHNMTRSAISQKDRKAKCCVIHPTTSTMLGTCCSIRAVYAACRQSCLLDLARPYPVRFQTAVWIPILTDRALRQGDITTCVCFCIGCGCSIKSVVWWCGNLQ